jgi:hypothetical protein
LRKRDALIPVLKEEGMRKNLPEMAKDADAIEARELATLQTRFETQPIDWDAFWKLPSGNVSHEAAVLAAIDGKGDR